MSTWRHRFSPRGKLRSYLLAWTLGPIALFVIADSVSLYQTLLQATAAAHDRLLRATAQQIGDLLRVERDGLTLHIPVALIEALEGSGNSRMFWRVIGFDGRAIAGDAELPPPDQLPTPQPTGMSSSYVTQIGAQRIHVLALYQPIELSQGQGVALILVGETLEARQVSAAALLRAVLTRQLVLMLVIAAVTWWVVNRALRPLDALSAELRQRSAADTRRLSSQGPDELQPVIDEMNQLLERQQLLMQQQQRFIADASHQLRTPLTVLKTQLQSVLGGDAKAGDVLPDMLRTVDRTTHLANQLLNQARVEQARHENAQEAIAIEAIVREAVLEMSPLIAAKRLDFELEVSSGFIVQGQAWLAGELVRNLLSNAIRHTPAQQALGVRLERVGTVGVMTVWDSGPGISEDMRAWLFQPFAASKGVAGAGLGLAICLEIASSMQARIDLINRLDTAQTVLGLNAIVAWNLHPQNEAPSSLDAAPAAT